MSEAVAGLGIPTAEVLPAASRRVIATAALGALFEWYDFYIYIALAVVMAGHFFPAGNETAALLATLAAYAAGFAMRPLGAILFGRLADRNGRKQAFLLPMLIMALATILVASLPGFSSIGWAAPTLLLVLRGLQSLAMGGSHGSAATFVAEHAAVRARGRAAGWVQAAAMLGFMLALLALVFCRLLMGSETFSAWGWRLPLLFTLPLLPIYAYARRWLDETPVFQRMLAEGRGSDAPLTETLRFYPNNGFVLLAVLGATAGAAAIWYTGHVYGLFFLTTMLKMDDMPAALLLAAALFISAPALIFFGWLSDRIGRLKIVMAGCLLAAVTYFPLFTGLTAAVNPALAEYQQRIPVGIAAAADCDRHMLPLPGMPLTACDQVRDFLIRAGLSYHSLPPQPGAPLVVHIGAREIHGFDPPKLQAALRDTGFPSAADPARIDYATALLILVVMLLYAGMVCGPLTAFLAEMFPARIRATSISLPLQLGHGWFGGLLPLVATGMVVTSGNIYMGLWYPIAIAAMSLVVGSLFLRDKLGRDLHA